MFWRVNYLSRNNKLPLVSPNLFLFCIICRTNFLQILFWPISEFIFFGIFWNFCGCGTRFYRLIYKTGWLSWTGWIRQMDILKTILRNTVDDTLRISRWRIDQSRRLLDNCFIFYNRWLVNTPLRSFESFVYLVTYCRKKCLVWLMNFWQSCMTSSSRKERTTNGIRVQTDKYATAVSTVDCGGFTFLPFLCTMI